MKIENKIALITGATSGIGYVTAVELAKKGFNLLIVARDRTKAEELQKEIGKHVQTWFIPCDLSSIASVNRAVEDIKTRVKKIDVLINNAGRIFQHKQFSVDHIELTFATNHIGAFVLTTGLIDLLKAGEKARIIHLSSEAHFFALFFDINKLVNPPRYQDLIVYGRSKLANILFSIELAARLQPFGITSNAVHPGTVASNFAADGTGATGLFMRLVRPFLKTTAQGAATSIYLATSPEVDGVTGKYFVNCKPRRTSRTATDKGLSQRLWELSEQVISLKPVN